MTKRKYPTVPSRIRVAAKKTYEIVDIESFADADILGECRYDLSQIVIKKGLSDKERFSTFIHEVIHMVSFENDANLTENQVLAMEHGLMKLLTLNKLI